MSQEQPVRDQSQEGGVHAQGIRYGDVFGVTGDLAGQTIAPQDAATMQRAEYAALGAPQPGGPADVMASAATLNQYTGVVRGNQASAAACEQGITITETPVHGGKIITEFVAGQAVGQYAVTDAQLGDEVGSGGQGGGGYLGDDDNTKLTIGEALEATARAIGNEPINASDAEAIRAAETTASGADVAIPGGVADAALAAASANTWATTDQAKIKIADVLSNATEKMPADKPAEPEDAAEVFDAEAGSEKHGKTRPGGVTAAVATAARINQDVN
ncbi:hypothetical protein LUZ62_016528 [Rhynchospora pubera]|uniref:SMP domain-containing protein n=1 Tax=Rhynchospora pubera TaxID=906938 RepID=A0AAV8GEZ0_9POAL|nr:hypothetical protein LUZ62_016528 [Rhynchospora pubera]